MGVAFDFTTRTNTKFSLINLTFYPFFLYSKSVMYKSSIFHLSKNLIITSTSFAILLSSCVTPCSQRVYKQGDLFSCVESGNVDKARLLYAQGESIYDECRGSLYHALSRNYDKDTFLFVKNLPINMEYEDSSGNTAIFVASGNVLRHLLEEGSNVNHTNKSGETAFLYQMNCALWSENELMLQERLNNLDMLIGYGYRLNENNRGHNTLEELDAIIFSSKLHLLGHNPDKFYENKKAIRSFLVSRIIP